MIMKRLAAATLAAVLSTAGGTAAQAVPMHAAPKGCTTSVWRSGNEGVSVYCIHTTHFWRAEVWWRLGFKTGYVNGGWKTIGSYPRMSVAAAPPGATMTMFRFSYR